MGHNVDGVLGTLDIALLFPPRFVELVNGSRRTPAAVFNSFMEVYGWQDAHQRPVDVGREDQATLDRHWWHHRRCRMAVFGEIRGRARVPLRQSRSRQRLQLDGDIRPSTPALSVHRTLEYRRVFVHAPSFPPVREALGFHGAPRPFDLVTTP